jgi:hypothetical protein
VLCVVPVPSISFRDCRKLLYLLLSIVGWGGGLALIIVMFIKFDDCDLSKFFVAFTLCLAVLTTLLSRTCGVCLCVYAYLNLNVL